MFAPATPTTDDILNYSPDASRLHWIMKARFYHLLYKKAPTDYHRALRDALFECAYQHDHERERTLDELRIYNNKVRDYTDLISFYEGKMQPTGVPA